MTKLTLNPPSFPLCYTEWPLSFLPERQSAQHQQLPRMHQFHQHGTIWKLWHASKRKTLKAARLSPEAVSCPLSPPRAAPGDRCPVGLGAASPAPGALALAPAPLRGSLGLTSPPHSHHADLCTRGENRGVAQGVSGTGHVRGSDGQEVT